VYAGYAKWCGEQQGIDPMTPQAFGTKPWNKDKNGKSWYRNRRLAAGYARQRLLLASSR
jgi:hypothetical protein